MPGKVRVSAFPCRLDRRPWIAKERVIQNRRSTLADGLELSGAIDSLNRSASGRAAQRKQPRMRILNMPKETEQQDTAGMPRAGK